MFNIIKSYGKMLVWNTNKSGQKLYTVQRETKAFNIKMLPLIACEFILWMRSFILRCEFTDVLLINLQCLLHGLTK